jgi:hypothetical protein
MLPKCDETTRSSAHCLQGLTQTGRRHGCELTTRRNGPNEQETGIVRSVVMADLHDCRIILRMEDGEHAYLAHIYFDNYDFLVKAYRALTDRKDRQGLW